LGPPATIADDRQRRECRYFATALARLHQTSRLPPAYPA
jgi:hypothetical protein